MRNSFICFNNTIYLLSVDLVLDLDTWTVEVNSCNLNILLTRVNCFVYSQLTRSDASLSTVRAPVLVHVVVLVHVDAQISYSSESFITNRATAEKKHNTIF